MSDQESAERKMWDAYVTELKLTHRAAVAPEDRAAFGRNLELCAECGELVHIPHIASCDVGDLCNVCSDKCKSAHERKMVRDDWRTVAQPTEQSDSGYQAALGFIARRNTEGRPVEYRTVRPARDGQWDVIEGGRWISTFAADGSHILTNGN